MTTSLEHRVREALALEASLVTGDPPPWRYRAPGTVRRSRETRLRLLVAAASTVAVAALVLIVVRGGEPGHGPASVRTGQLSGPTTRVGLASSPLSAQAVPVAAEPRPVLADVATLQSAPIARASLAFQAGSPVQGDSRASWFVADPDTGSLRAVADLPVAGAGDLSDDGRSLVYTNPLADGRSVVAIADIVTGHVSAFARPSAIVAAAWSPTGTRLALVETANSDARRWISVVDRNGSVLAAGTVGSTGVGAGLAWSPDGSQLAVLGCDGVPPCHPAVLNVATDEVRPAAHAVVWLGWLDNAHLLAERPYGGFLVTDTSGAVVREVPLDGTPLRSGPRSNALSPDRASILVRPPRSGVGQAFAEVVDVASGTVTRQLVAPMDGIPTIVGWRSHDVLVARERPGRIELVQVSDTVANGTTILVLPFRDEGFSPQGIVLAGWFIRQ